MPSLLYNLLKVSYNEVCPMRRGFHIKDESSRIHLNQIGTTFLNGYHASLRYKINFDKIIALSEEEDFYYKGFFFEGVGMGLTLIDFITLTNKSYFKKFITLNQSHKYMLNIGAGWAFARLPFVSIEKQLKNYDSLLCVFLLNGYGFHQAFFQKIKYIDKRFVPMLSEKALHPFYQGVGRALWFVCGLEIELIFKTINLFPNKFHIDLWEGVGLASTYAGKVSMGELKLLKDLSKINLSSLQQGSSFAAGARSLSGLVHEYTEFATDVLTDLNVAELSNINDLALSDINKNSDPFSQNMQWKKGIINRLKKTEYYT